MILTLTGLLTPSPDVAQVHQLQQEVTSTRGLSNSSAPKLNNNKRNLIRNTSLKLRCLVALACDAHQPAT